MGKKRWHKRLSVTVLAAILAVNYGGANISARAKEIGSAMYADAAENIVYTISHASEGFSVSGGALTDTNVTTLTAAVEKILAQSKTKKVAIDFDNIVSSEIDGIELNTPCELTLTGSYEAVGS